MSEMTWFALQRLSAKILAPLVLLHLGLILYASHGGLSAAEILARTQGSWLWGAVYVLFVTAAAVHAPAGLRNVLREWAGWRGASLDVAMLALGAGFLALGLRAVWGLVA